MNTENFIPIVDLFAGPGGLGEGFSSLESDIFRIVVSAEMDPAARETLRLRAFYRMLKRQGENALGSYYDYCNHGTAPFDDSSEAIWHEAGREALQLTLGNPDDNRTLDSVIRKNGLGPDAPWVLIGGPPCQAYSLVGRSRNRGKSDYKAEDDHRHFLYLEYLRIIQKYRPAVFVMENVTGILSSSVGGQRIFHSILRDVADPDLAIGKNRSGTGYRIHSLSHATCYDKFAHPDDIDARDFIVRAEEYGIPQARHRVILLGVRDDLDVDVQPLERKAGKDDCTVADVLANLPALRSRLSKQEDNGELWAQVVRKHFKVLEGAAADKKLHLLVPVLQQYAGGISRELSSGALRFPKQATPTPWSSERQCSYDDSRLNVWLNHEARAHMSSDLLRYAYAAAFAKTTGRSPKGHNEFDLLDELRPLHANWESGKFSDRFRVQLKDSPATTVTSHISKDGHYFIHYDPAQCRSLTVREAARLQTFPDNYFFQGNRTQQYHQVGNAVPPRLASRIADVVSRILR